MALFSMRMQVIKRSAGRSAIAAAAYRSGENLFDERQHLTHDYRNRGGVERSEILLPTDAPGWVQHADREALWNAVEAGENRKDAQTARELRIMIPRELSPDQRITVVRDFVVRNFVSRGMVADVCWHNKTASDGLENVHAHCMLTMRPLTEDGFGKKSRHDRVPDPEGRVHADGRPVMIESNTESWNSIPFYEGCRLDWENTANAALARAGSAERIDRRSLLERGLARLPEPALRLAHYLKDLRGVMQQRFGQWQYARHYRAVEDRAREAFAKANPSLGAAQAARTTERFFGWFDRQLERLGPAPAVDRNERVIDRDAATSPSQSTPDLER